MLFSDSKIGKSASKSGDLSSPIFIGLCLSLISGYFFTAVKTKFCPQTSVSVEVVRTFGSKQTLLCSMKRVPTTSESQSQQKKKKLGIETVCLVISVSEKLQPKIVY